jgi:LacI family transcriptional regulator
MNKRREAYLDSLKEAGFKYNKKLELKLPYTQDKEDLIKSISEFLKTLPKGTAVFFATNYLGIAGLESCTRLKLRIPADLSVITFDDDDLFRLYPPGITTIQQPVSEIAKTAIELLVQQINNSSSPLKQQQILLPPKLMIRGSV